MDEGFEQVQALEPEDHIVRGAGELPLAAIIRVLVTYREKGAAAKEMTAKALLRLTAMHEAYLAMEEEARELLRDLRPLWATLDAAATGEGPWEAVETHLKEFNALYGKNAGGKQ